MKHVCQLSHPRWYCIPCWASWSSDANLIHEVIKASDKVNWRGQLNSWQFAISCNFSFVNDQIHENIKDPRIFFFVLLDLGIGAPALGSGTWTTWSWLCSRRWSPWGGRSGAPTSAHAAGPNISRRTWNVPFWSILDGFGRWVSRNIGKSKMC